MRYRSIVETIANLILNVVLGYFYGINGIVMATIISLFFFNFLWGATIVFKNYFGNRKLKKYFFYHARYAITTFLVCFISFFITMRINHSVALVELIIKGIVCIFVTAFFYLCLYGKSKVFKQSLNMIRKK